MSTATPLSGAFISAAKSNGALADGRPRVLERQGWRNVGNVQGVVMDVQQGRRCAGLTPTIFKSDAYLRTTNGLVNERDVLSSF